MSTYPPSDTSTCILHPCWYNTGSDQPEHQKEKKSSSFLTFKPALEKVFQKGCQGLSFSFCIVTIQNTNN